MKNKNIGMLVVISAPAGSGKGTVIKQILEKGENFVYSVSATTRRPREGEQNGKEYYFLTRGEFEKNIAENKMLEYAEYCGNYYGTPLEKVQEHLENGKNVILEIEVQGALKVKSKMPDAVMIFILPPSYKILRERLINRGTEDMNTIEKRLLQAKEEIAAISEYEYIVVNNTGESEKCAEEILNIVKSQKHKYKYAKSFLDDFFNE